MVEKTITGIKKGLTNSEDKAARTDGDVDMIVAGGTSAMKGFDVLFNDVAMSADLPLKIGKIVRPEDPLYSVARGCLVAAENAAQ
jgi:hypothetical protein